jgi:ETC complex I subunit conserved region
MNIAPLSDHSDFTARRPFPETPVTKSVFPADAQAVIYKAAPSPMTSRRASAQQWTLRFERRSAPYIEPLMGWTGDDDTLAQVELSFFRPSKPPSHMRAAKVCNTQCRAWWRRGRSRDWFRTIPRPRARPRAGNVADGWNGSSGHLVRR